MKRRRNLEKKIQTLADYQHTCLREDVDIFDSFLMASPLSLIGDISSTNDDSRILYPIYLYIYMIH